MQEVEKEYGVPVVPIIALEDIIKYVEGKEEMKEYLERIRAYREEWGIKQQ